MTRVMGIGYEDWLERKCFDSWWFRPAHANKLVQQEKIKTIEELRAHPKRDSLLNKTQQLGLKYLEEFEQKIPRDEMKEMEVRMIL